MFPFNILVTFIGHSLYIFLVSFSIQEEVDEVLMVAAGSVGRRRVLLPTGKNRWLESIKDCLEPPELRGVQQY